MAKLVALGDSLTQGFQSLAITHTDRSFPAMIAGAMGLGPADFACPDFSGKGGMPCSIEWLARRLEVDYGHHLDAFDWVRAIPTLVDAIDEVEQYWERGRGSLPGADVLFHNLASWGFSVADAWNVEAAACAAAIRGSKDDWFQPPSQPRLRTALHVLNPGLVAARASDTQLAVAERIRDRDGIEHLIAWYGGNNCLKTILELKIVTSDDAPPSICTLFTTAAFAADYAVLAERLASLGANHTYVATVPHITIPPLTRGIMANGGPLPAGHKYFDYYTYFFTTETDFDPERDPHLTLQDAMRIDTTIDGYNAEIRRQADLRGWQVIEICDMLDHLAVRRNDGSPSYRLPAALAGLTVEMLGVDPSGAIDRGGLIGLDGIHPTNCGYALIAQEFIEAMRQFEPAIRDLDFAAIRRDDPLVSQPPRTLTDMVGVLRSLERRFHLTRWMLD